MRRYSRLVLALVVFGSPGLARPAGLPVVEGADFRALAQDCRRLLAALDARKAPLPGPTRKALEAALRSGASDPEGAAVRVQQVLDRHCLIGVSINPESRVKASRGPAPANLVRGKEVFFLIKVQNEAGVTHALKIASRQFRRGRAGPGRWLDGAIRTDKALRPTLSGRPVEYVVLGLVAHEAGKREATFRFDVGQGTQDLGFRAEVPVLFKVSGANR